MMKVAILGAGSLGGSIAAALVWREACSRVVLIDDLAEAAAGKALDILQSCAIAGCDVRLCGSSRVDMAGDADVMVVADPATGKAEWQGEAGLAVMARILATNPSCPVVLADAGQDWLVERAVLELGRPRGLVLGSAALAFEAALQAMTALETDRPARDVTLRLVGRPPTPTAVLWESGLVAGVPAPSVLDTAAMRRIEGRLAALWPPGPYALASAASAVIAALLGDANRTLTCLCLPEGARTAVALPVRLAGRAIAEVRRQGADARSRLALGEFP